MMSSDFAAQRLKMVDCQIRTTDVTNAPIVDAMREIPREAFVPAHLRDFAYIDEDLLIAPASERRPARYLMEPSPFAKLVQLAAVRPTDMVLDVGCGTGYSSAVLSRLAASVVALECDPELARQAKAALALLGCDNVEVVEGELNGGVPSKAPYDLILIGGAVEEVPAALVEQMKEGGRLVAVIGEGNAAEARLYVKSQGLASGRSGFNAAVKPLPGFQRAPSFVF